MYGLRRVTFSIASVLYGLRNFASAVGSAPLPWGLGFAATAITLVVGVSAVRLGGLVTDAVVEIICAVMAVGVAATEWSSAGRLQRRRRQRGARHQPR